MNLEEIRQHYFFQFSRKGEVQSTPQFASTLIVVFVGALSFYAPRLTWEIGLLEVLCVLAALCVCAAATLVAIALVGSKYGEISAAEDLLAYNARLTEYYALNSTPDGDAKSEYDAILLQKYAAVVDQNARMNRGRAARVYNAHCALVVAGVSLGIAVFPYAERVGAPAPMVDPQTTEMNQMSGDKNEEQGQDSGTSAGAQKKPAEPPPKPEPPANLETRDGSGKATKKDG